MNHEDKLQRLLAKLRAEPDESAQAAVAILVRPTGGDLKLFLVKRAEVPGDPWSGDMAFPGGKRCPEDGTLTNTAVRELLEETAIDLSGSKPLGFMAPVYSTVRNNMAVQPVVFMLDEEPEYSLNYELSKAGWETLDRLKSTRQLSTVKGYQTPVYRAVDEVVWGLTFRMIKTIIELVDR